MISIMLAVCGIMSAPAAFDAKADASRLQSFAVEGLVNPVAGTVYPAGALEDGGMPLGGIGTGYLCVDTDGRIGKASIFNRLPSPLMISKPFLSVACDGKTYVAATAKDGVGDAVSVDYFGHFPVLDARLGFDGPLAVSLSAYSPFILGDAVESNTPAVVFEVTVANTSAETKSFEIAFAPEGFPEGELAAFSSGNWAGVEVVHRPLEGLPDWVRHSYALAAEDGVGDASGKVARVSAKREIPAGGNAVARFILTWHQRYLREGGARVEQHVYAQRWADAKAVAGFAIERHASWLKRVLGWQNAIYGASLPAWVKETLINAPYVLCKNSVWLAHTRPDDWWGDEGLFLVNESFSTCALTETMPCRFFGHWPALFFFPELELSTLKAIRYFQLRGGEPPFCMGLGFAIRDPRYHCQHTAGAGEYAQMIYRYYLRTGDRAFFDAFWESARDSLRFMMTLDCDGDGLVEDHAHAIAGENFPANNPMDQWPWYGASSYTAGKGLASLVCGIAMAELAGDTAQASEWRALLEKGQKSYEEKLWTGSYYRTYNDVAGGRVNASCLAGQMSSVWCTRVLGLPDPLPGDRIDTSLDAVARLNMPASPYGMVNAVFEDGTWCVEGGGSGIPDTCWSRDIFTQCNATAAMAFLYRGKAVAGSQAGETMMNTIFRGPHAMPWAQPCGLSSKSGGTCHGHDYYDHMVVWSYPLAFAGQGIAEACGPNGFIQQVLNGAKP